MKPIISFDLDMTLLNHATMTIPDSALAALDRLRENYCIVLGTARDMDTPNSSIYRDIIRPDAIVHNDGTKITVGDQLIYETFMPKNLIRRVLEFGEKESLAVGWLTGTEDYFTHPDQVEAIDILRWGESRRNFQDPWEALDYPVRTMIYVGYPEGAAKLAEAFPELDCPLIASRLGADLMEKEKSKAVGLKRLCDYLGVDISKCYAFGDSMNDYAILQEVGCGIAMGNAPDELKAVADYVTADIADDGVYKACVALGLIAADEQKSPARIETYAGNEKKRRATSMNENLQNLRSLMAQRGVDAYMVPTADFHLSEYVDGYFKCRRFLTGFTGSAGTAVVTAKEACLWTDGRYFVQAAKELEGSGFTLMKMGEEGVPEIEDYLADVLPEGGVLGFDGRVVSSQTGKRLKEKLEEKKATLSYGQDLVGEIWADRPALSAEPVWILGEEYTGKSASDKIAQLRQKMKEMKATVHILTSMDDIVWLLNIRGNDVPCNPVVLSYAVVTMDELDLFINEATLNGEVRDYLQGIGVTVKPYNDIYEFVKSFRNESVLMQLSRTNYALVGNLDGSNRIIDRTNPTTLAKAVKNPVEVENMKRAHIKDGVAVTKFIYWMKKNVGKIPMTEISVSDYLEELRRQQDGNLGLSFDTISAYGPNAAMCHYSATPESDAVIQPRGLYLVDSGGQYYEGTTDITRTIAVGPITGEEREHFTLVAMSMLRLGHVKFLYGSSGMTLDYVAREPFWSRGLNFNHGTGHGVGYLLNVHEGPVGFRWKAVPERTEWAAFEEGMVCSDEPGVYIEGSHGVRTENLLVCRKAEKNEYGQFMEFEYLTYVPIDLDALDVSLMEKRDIEYLNEYHKQVYEKISPYLNDEEKAWLKEATREI